MILMNMTTLADVSQQFVHGFFFVLIYLSLPLPS
jgi:hypothetical protein